jgi:glycosyltransferase involved in cell wall biosynthesis
MESLPYSIVIPTRNRWKLLREVLEALGRQEGAPPFEVIVVDDGSTEAGFDPETLHHPYPIRCLRQESRGPAAARNRGVRVARGQYVAFLGDDTVPEPNWLREHESAHRARGHSSDVAVLGYTAWHPRIRVTPWLEYLNEEGPQFGYRLINDPERVGYPFFYTSNVSLARSWLLEEPFDESFPDAAWEDIEAAWRMTRKGLRIVYHPVARVLHDHPTDPEQFRERQIRAGRSAVRFAQLHPELSDWLGIGPNGPPSPAPRWLQSLRRSLVRSLHFTPLRWRALWREALRDAYLQGLHEGWKRLEERRR